MLYANENLTFHSSSLGVASTHIYLFNLKYLLQYWRHFSHCHLRTQTSSLQS